MSVVRLEEVTKRFGGETVLDAVSLQVERQDKVGLIGRNGTGKSTLFRLIEGAIEPDGGRIERMRRMRIACLDQLPDLDEEASIETVALGAFEELARMESELAALEKRLANDESLLAEYSALQERFEVLGGYEYRARARQVLGGLGFSEAEYAMPAGALSGGQRTRLLLALVLLEDADLLLLDEPENHLDIAARIWLERFLRDWPRAFVLISHDRQILDAAIDRVIEVERGGLRFYTGNYTAYKGHKALAAGKQQSAHDRQRKLIEKEEAWIERFRYKSTKAKQVQSRIKRLEKLERIDAPNKEEAAPRFCMAEAERTGDAVVEADALRMAYGDLVLYDGLSFRITRGERVGIAGPNGSGKTTLLRQLAGRLPGAQGTVRLGHKVQLGFFHQHHENLNRETDVYTEIRNARPDLTPEQVRTFLGKFLFSGEDVFKPVSGLSGGELSRLAMAKLILSGANVLLLDEPTNHLDIASQEALEEALLGYNGTLLMVTHDRALLDKLANRLILIEKDGVHVYPGNYSEFQQRQEEAGASLATGEDAAADAMRIRDAKPAVRKRVRDKERQAEQRRQRRKLEQLEADILALEETISDVEAQSAALDPNDFERARELQETHEGLRGDLAEMYDEWERLADEIAAS